MTKYDFAKLQKLIRRIHNARVAADMKAAKTTAKKTLLEYALIDPQDTAQLILAKQQYYYFSLGNISKIVDTNVVFPEWWALRAGSDRPQLVLVFKSLSNKRSYNKLIIPQYEGQKIKKPPIPSYTRGDYRGCLVLKDNSKFICYAASENEAELVISKVKPHIRSKYLNNSTVTIGTTRKKNFSNDTMTAVLAKYFSAGQHRNEPDWTVYF